MENKNETTEKWYEKKKYIFLLVASGGGPLIFLLTAYPFGLYQLWKSDKFEQWKKIALTAIPILLQLLSIYKATR